MKSNLERFNAMSGIDRTMILYNLGFSICEVDSANLGASLAKREPEAVKQALDERAAIIAANETEKTSNTNWPRK